MADSLGQLMIIGFEGTTPSDELLKFIHDEEIGGVIIFRWNYKSKRQLADLIAEIKRAAREPLFVAIDHEGGRVFRLGKPFTHFPAAAKLDGSPYEVGRKMAGELSSVGINLNFAPVLDVATNVFNTVIGDRAFSSDPKIVAERGVQLMQGLLDGSVIACGKHFPGHGDTDLDSHMELPVLPHTRRRLDACELYPFRSAISSNIPMMMTAHVLLPNIDPKWPASISRQITTDLLRRELGFGGVIVTDDLLMKGISNFMPVTEAACKAVEAGADLILLCKDIALQRQVLDELRNAKTQGRFGNIQERLDRINNLKNRFRL